MTPSQLYRQNRPEYFSDSMHRYRTVLPREVLAFELDQLSTNQKQDEFESLARRLLERFVSPNLIPQVGPTGGGDGKTDIETHPVSEDISARWYVRQKGWKPEENWAFAISTKKDWSTKCRSDVSKIVATGRGYTTIFFVTSRKPSSKAKKELQDKLKRTYNIPVTIFDAEWILAKIYENDLIELAVDTLNLSTTYKEASVEVGAMDRQRLERLAELEERLSSPDYMAASPYQMTEDALEAAILCRMLERPREEVLGKFDRAKKHAIKNDSQKLRLRVSYQYAWTLLNWYDDYGSFIDEFKELRALMTPEASSREIENYLNLLFLLRGLTTQAGSEQYHKLIQYEKEKMIAKQILEGVSNTEGRPCATLTAGIHIEFLDLVDFIKEPVAASKCITKIESLFDEGAKYIDFPFVTFKELAMQMGDLFSDNEAYESLVDKLVLLSSTRDSELASAEILQQRGYQKLIAKRFKDSIVYLGRSIVKLAKEESKEELVLSLRMLSDAYDHFGLPWASLAAQIAASEILFREWFQNGKVRKRLVSATRDLAQLELRLGRISNFLEWNMLAQMLERHIGQMGSEGEIPYSHLVDGCLAVRIMNTPFDVPGLEDLPAILAANDLGLSENATLFKLGYGEEILTDYAGVGIRTVEELTPYFQTVRDQPFFDQMWFATDLCLNEKLTYSTKLLGCQVKIDFLNTEPMHLVAETILAFLESFFATSVGSAFPSTEVIQIKIKVVADKECFRFVPDSTQNSYTLLVDAASFASLSQDSLWNSFVKFVSEVLAKHFMVQDLDSYLKCLFETEETNQRISMVIVHPKLVKNILGAEYKYNLKTWISPDHHRSYTRQVNNDPVPPRAESYEQGKMIDREDFDSVGHASLKVQSVIDIPLWDKAGWQGFGFFGDGQRLGIILAFANQEIGKEIFEGWEKRLGSVDRNENIRLVIIKGVCRANPSWYRVIVGSRMDTKSLEQGTVITSVSRIHLMQPDDSRNLDKLTTEFRRLGHYLLCPAKTDDSGRIEPKIENGIVKSELTVRWAWSVGVNDPDAVAIGNDDDPIIPPDEVNAPVLELLKKKRNR